MKKAPRLQAYVRGLATSLIFPLFSIGILIVTGWAGTAAGKSTQSSRTEGPSQPAKGADPSLEHYVQQADQAIRALQIRLLEAVTREMKRGGPAGAVRVCRDEAQAITTMLAQEKGIAVGRTSHRLRNPVNAPRDWMEPFVDDGAGKRTKETEPHVVDLGDRVGVLKPIDTLELCTNCHGGEDRLAPEVKAVLADAYPDDRATGFGIGDLRGWMWAEVPRE